MKKYIIRDCIETARKREGRCLEAEYINSDTKMKWKCKKSHIWFATYTDIKSGRWCKKCFLDRNKFGIGLEKANKIAESRGGKCLSKRYITAHIKMLWKCKNHHVWKATYNKVQQGTWCMKCANLQRMSTIEDARKIANRNNGKCISKVYTGSRKKMLWECKNRHRWLAKYDSVVAGTWCPMCRREKLSKLFRLSNERIHSIAKKNGGICISTKGYRNVKSEVIWKCKNNHIWSASLMSVISNNWCPECCSSSGQKHLANIIREIFPKDTVYTNYRKIKWLYNKKTNRRLEIDIFIKNKKIAIEYDGEQHFKPVRFGSMTKKAAEGLFKKNKKLYRLKESLINNHKKEIRYFIRFNYTERRKFDKEYIIQKLRECGVKI